MSVTADVVILFTLKGQFGLASWKCSEESFAHQVKIRDPLKIGLVFLFLSTSSLPPECLDHHHFHI